MKLPNDFQTFAKGVEMEAAVRKRAAEIEREDKIAASGARWYPRAWADDETPYARPSPQLQAMMEIDEIERKRDIDRALVGLVIDASERDRKMATATAQLDETERQHKPMTLDDYLDAYVELRDSEIGRRRQAEMDRARSMGFVIERRFHRPDGSFVVGDDATAPADRKFWNTNLGQPWRPEGEQS